MLIELRLRNYKCFRDEQVLSLLANSDNSHPENVTNSVSTGNLNVLKTVAIYGANGSGKSKLLQAMNFIDNFVSTSFLRKPNASIAVGAFLFDEDSQSAPTDFEVTFIQKNIRYQYGFSVDRNRVYKEWLFSWPRGRQAAFFERAYDKVSDADQYKFGDLLKGEKEKIRESTRPNALFLSTAAILNHKQLQEVYEWFMEGLRGWSSNDIPLEAVSDIIKQDKYKNAIISLLRSADIPIEDYEVHEETLMLSDDVPEKTKRIISGLYDDAEDPKRTRVILFRKDEDGKTFALDLEKDESEGTNRFFKLSALILQSLEKTGVIYVDELDSSFHPLLTREVIKLFHNPQVNCNNVQLIFNTHDTTLLDLDLFRRDQIWFVEKKPDNSSEVYSLAEFSPRKNEALAKGYLQGRYGAIPFIGELTRELTNEGC
jgi:AAA15 family ATPase/GTPase